MCLCTKRLFVCLSVFGAYKLLIFGKDLDHITLERLVTVSLSASCYKLFHVFGQ